MCASMVGSIEQTRPAVHKGTAREGVEVLPDFPAEKSLVAARIALYVDEETRRRTPLLFEIPRYAQHEGRRHKIVREDGSVSNNPIVDLSEPVHLDWTKILDGGPRQLGQCLDHLIENMAKRQSKHVLDVVHEAATEVGNVVDAGGRPLTPVLFLELLGKLEIDFDPDGTPHMPSLVMHPSQGRVLQEKLEKWFADPSFRGEFGLLLTRKKAEWRVREARRILVD